MNHLNTHIDPISTSQLLTNLNLAIDEAKLVRTIANVSDQIYKIENSTGPSPRTRFLRSEVAKLEQELATTRNRAEQRMTI